MISTIPRRRRPSFQQTALFALLLFAAAIAAAQEHEPVEFQDPALERAVRGQFVLEEDEPLLAPDVANLDRLIVEWPEDQDRISDLTGIEALKNLTYLNLRDHDVEDLQPLAGLTELESLTLSRTRVSSLAPLAPMQHLESLDASKNLLTDTAGLANSSALRFVDLSGNRIEDISELAGAQQLESLLLHENALTDISALADLPNLYRLSLYGNPTLDTCPGSEARRVIDGLLADGVDVAFAQRGAGDAACAEEAAATPLRIAMETGGQQESIVVDGGQLARLNPDGSRVVVSCVGTLPPVHFINEESGVYWYGPISEFAHQLSSFIAVQLLPNDPEVRYAVDVRVEEVGGGEQAGYEAQQYKVEWRPDAEEGGADHAWQLMQELWVAPELGEELRQTGCFEVATFLEAIRLMQGTFSSQRFYGVQRSRDYTAAATDGFPVRAVMHAPGSGETVVTQVTGVDSEKPLAELFELPEGLERVDGVSGVF